MAGSMTQRGQEKMVVLKRVTLTYGHLTTHLEYEKIFEHAVARAGKKCRLANCPRVASGALSAYHIAATQNVTAS